MAFRTQKRTDEGKDEVRAGARLKDGWAGGCKARDDDEERDEDDEICAGGTIDGVTEKSTDEETAAKLLIGECDGGFAAGVDEDDRFVPRAQPKRKWTSDD